MTGPAGANDPPPAPVAPVLPRPERRPWPRPTVIGVALGLVPYWIIYLFAIIMLVIGWELRGWILMFVFLGGISASGAVLLLALLFVAQRRTRAFGNGVAIAAAIGSVAGVLILVMSMIVAELTGPGS